MVLKRVCGADVRDGHAGKRLVGHDEVQPRPARKFGVAGTASRPGIGFSVQRNGLVRKVHLADALHTRDEQVLPVQRHRLPAAARQQGVELAQGQVFVRPAHKIVAQHAAAEGGFPRRMELEIHF